MMRIKWEQFFFSKSEVEIETEYQKRNCLFLDERESGLVVETDGLKGKSNS